MKTYLPALSLFAIITFGATYYFSNDNFETSNCKQKKQSQIPIPTEVNERMENEEEWEQKKEAYEELIHGGGQWDWRAINKQNHFNRMETIAALKNSKAVESYANGAIAGEWIERGSRDQAGNARIAAFDQETENVYTIGDGGILFRGQLNGSNWEPLNDHYLLDKDALLSIRIPGNTHRLLACIGNGVYYSDDEGQTWTASTGFVGSTWDGNAIDLIQLNDADSTIVFLYTYVSVAGNGSNKLAYSKDHGQTFTVEHQFGSGNQSWASMCWVWGSDVAYILDNDDDTWRFEDDHLTQMADAMDLQGSFTCQMEATTNGADTILYVLMDDQYLYKSTDAGYNFTQLPDLPVPAWDVGIGTSIDNPNAVYFGEMELYHSLDGGNSFTKVADWWEYYDDVPNKIHADIMNFNTFKRSNGDEFTLIPNHGGVSISYDNLNTTPNIGMQDLNIGQFYDVATSPVNSSLVMGGTQDQGLQRTAQGDILTAINFEQVISGDYGEQQYSNNGISFWTQYPGADFSYYGNALTDGGAAFWHTVDGSNLPNAGWIVPTASAPNPSDDYILVAGGDINGGTGSHIVKLENGGGFAIETQFPFDFDADANAPLAAIETTPYDDQKWYASTENGHFYFSTDAGNNWTESDDIVGPGSNWIYAGDIYASRLTEDLVFLGGTNYWTSPVYMSEDGGQTFIPLADGALPATMVHELCMDATESFLFAATDAGPYVYDMAQEEWFDLGGTSAPVQEYISVEYVETENIVRFATWGRGIWDFKMADVTGVEEKVEQQLNHPYPNPSNGQFNIQVEDYQQAKIFNMQGQEVAHIALLQGVNHMNLSFLGSGTYLMVSMSNDGIIRKNKLVFE